MTKIDNQTGGIATFTFDSAAVRVATRNNSPWFVAKDAADAAQITWKGSQTLGPLSDDEKATISLDSPGGPQETIIISESGLYTLILRSQDATVPDTPAYRFRRWVTSEVLPQIRKTGGYHLPQTFAQALRALADREEENERLRLTVQQQAPAVEFVQNYVQAEGLFGIRQTAKILGVTQNAFVDMCITRKVLFRENGSLQPFAEWLEAGYFKVKTGEANEHAFSQTRFTSKGVEWVRGKLEINKLLALPS